MHVRACAALLLAVLAGPSLAGCVGGRDEVQEQPALPPVARAQAESLTVQVGAPLRFTSEGTHDPGERALSYAWDFGDGHFADAPQPTHAYEKPGEYRVSLRVENDEGASDTDTLRVVVVAENEAPVARFVVREGGREVGGAKAGARLVFDASGSHDADDDALAHKWDFGDGTTYAGATATHAFPKPGLYLVRLQVDDGEQTGEASRLIAIDGEWETRSRFGVGDAERKTFRHPVPEGLRVVDAQLTYPGGLGANTLELIVRDANGVEVARTQGRTPPGAQDEQVRSVSLTAEAVRAYASGDWSFQVVRERGVEVDFELVVRARF